MSAKPSDFSVISCKNRSLEFCTIFKCLVSLKADANASNILSNIENFWCWKKCKTHLRACKIYKKEKRRRKSRYTILDDVWSRSNFSSNIFWFIQPDFHVGCICVQFNPTFGFSSLRWVQNICGGVCFKRFYWHSNINDLWRATKNQIKRREDHKQDKREEAKMASKKEKDSNAKNDWTDHEVSLLMSSHSDWKNWKDSKIGKIHLSLNSVESVQASNCIQLDWPHQVFFFSLGWN